MSYDEGIA